MSGEQWYSAENFFDELPMSPKNDPEMAAGRVMSSLDTEEDGNKESFVSAIEQFIEVSSPKTPEDDHEGADDVSGAGGIVMSTIEEESKSCYESSTAPSASHSFMPVEDRPERVANTEIVDETKFGETQGQEHDLDVSAELKEFEKLVSETQAGSSLEQTRGISTAVNQLDTESEFKLNDPVLSSAPSGATDDAHVEELLNRLGQLQSTQDILEKVLDSGTTLDADELTAWISQFPTPLRSCFQNEPEDVSERSVSAEIASIQKIVDAGIGIEMIETSNSQHSEVAEGNNLLSASDIGKVQVGTTIASERAVEDVLREYEELEQSYSRASNLDDSFRSDVSSVPPLSTHSNRQGVKFEPVEPNAPMIKPPVLKNIVPASTSSSTNKPLTLEKISDNPHSEMIPPYPPSLQNSSKPSKAGSQPVKPVAVYQAKSSRPDNSRPYSATQVSHTVSQSVRQAGSPPRSNRDNTQDAYKPRNRRMRSPRTIVSPKTPATGDSCGRTDQFRGNVVTTKAGSGESCQQVKASSKPNINEPRQVTGRVEVADTDALKTIQKLATTVDRQETLLEAYAKDNEKLWTQLKDTKSEFVEKESNYQDVINSLRTELATLKLNRLVTTTASSKANANSQTHHTLSSPMYNKAELDRLREDAEMKSQQLMELRREVLILQNKLAEKQTRPTVPKTSVSGGTSALAFHEKEKEYQKEVTALKKQVRTLQKILYSKDSASAPSQQQTSTGGNKPGTKPLQRTKSDISKSNTAHPHQALISSIRNTGVTSNSLFPKRQFASTSPTKGVTMNSSDIIQASLNCMEQERDEFEKIIEEKNKLIFEKERTILNLKEQVETLKSQVPEGDVVEPGLVDELRSRIITQNQAIHSLKEHLSAYRRMEAENLLLREEKSLLEQQVQELRRKLDFAQHLVKPENEVLFLLSEKVDELNSKYHHREKQLDTLLSRLTLKTTGGGCGTGLISSSNSSSSSIGLTTKLSPRKLPFDQFNNNNESLGGPALTIGKARPTSALISADILHMADLSPSSSFQLYNSATDLPDM